MQNLSGGHPNPTKLTMNGVKTLVNRQFGFVTVQIDNVRMGEPSSSLYA